MRRFRVKHEDTEPDSAGYLPSDGMQIYVSQTDDTPGDSFV